MRAGLLKLLSASCRFDYWTSLPVNLIYKSCHSTEFLQVLHLTTKKKKSWPPKRSKAAVNVCVYNGAEWLVFRLRCSRLFPFLRWLILSESVDRDLIYRPMQFEMILMIFSIFQKMVNIGIVSLSVIWWLFR